MTLPGAVVGTITVTLFSDGGTEVGRTVGVTDDPHALRLAASVLASLAAKAEREQQPVMCGTCAAAVQRAITTRMGAVVLGPCGHPTLEGR